MNWVLRKLAGAAIAGIGMKLGADAYDALKKRFGDDTAPEPDSESAEDFAGQAAKVRREADPEE